MASLGNGYVSNADLTPEYIQLLLDRCSPVWSDVTEQYPQYVDQYGALYVLQGFEGSINIAPSLSGARTILINAYVVMANS